MSLEILEIIRNWTLLLFAVVGVTITLITFRQNIKQRRLENTYKTLDFLRKNISEKQIQTWIYLFHANNPLSGDPQNYFRFEKEEYDTIEGMFSEGGCGNGDIHNMIEVFNLVSKDLRNGSLREDIIWYEYGQIMLKCFEWTYYLEKESRKEYVPPNLHGKNERETKKIQKAAKDNYELMNVWFADFNRYMEKTTILDKPTKHYTYVE